jgi:hypothetical protein
MRKRYRVLIFAALVAALVVPVGYALSVESTPTATHAAAGYAAVATAGSVSIVPTAAAAAVVAPMAVHVSSDAPLASALRPVSDATKLFGIGTLLIGLAAVVRKAI